MKYILLISFIIACSFNLTAQPRDLVVYSNDGHKFYLIVNGIRQNENPLTNVLASNLSQRLCNVRILFENKTFAPLDAELSLEDYRIPNSEYHEYSYSIVYKKNRFRLKYMGFAPFANDRIPLPPVASSSQDVFSAPAPDRSLSTGIGGAVGNTGVTINVGIGNTNTTVGSPVPPSHSHPSPVYNMPGYNGPIGCPWPMSSRDFDEGLSSINKNVFDDDKLMVANQIISNNCFTTQQVSEVAKLFTFDDKRLVMLKTCYDHTFDQGNYYKMFPLLTFSRSKENLEAFLNAKK
ncbi:MAG TPA: DUF4476 domain-containing protein [Cytophagaceae bacterium]|jgi:hypothetical protein